jgi:hypothetical protein
VNKKRLNKNSTIHDMNRAFYTGLMGALAVLISSFIFFFTIPESGEDSFLFVRLFLISFISGAFMLFSLFINPPSKNSKSSKSSKVQKVQKGETWEGSSYWLFLCSLYGLFGGR